MAGVAGAATASAAAGIEFIAGLEFTAVCDGRDLHVLGRSALAPTSVA